MHDSFLHKGLRTKLVDEVRSKGIKDERILNTIGTIPRHAFMDSGFINYSYKDQAFPIGEGQTISQPYTVAFQTELLEIKKNDKVLEIGTGSGYQAAVLLELGAIVYTIERIHKLFLKTQSLLPKLGYHPRFFYGDGYKGLPTYAPFDKILLTAAIAEFPDELFNQLKVGGIMVMPQGGAQNQVMKKISKTDNKNYTWEEHGNFVFVPMVKGKAN